MQSVSQAYLDYIEGDSLQFAPKVEIAYMDSSRLKGASVTTSSNLSPIFNPESLIDGYREECFAYAVSDTISSHGEPIIANGTWVAAPEEDDDIVGERGWVSGAMSNASGLFSPTQNIQILYDEAPVNRVFLSTSYYSGRVKDVALNLRIGSTWVPIDIYRFSGSTIDADLGSILYAFKDQTSNFPVFRAHPELYVYHYSIYGNVDSTVKIYDATSIGSVPIFIIDIKEGQTKSITLPKPVGFPNGIYVEVDGNVEGSIGYGFNYIMATGALVEVRSTQHPNDFARMHQVDLMYVEDVSEDVVTMNVSKVREELESTVPVGLTAANSMNLTLDNTSGKYNRDGGSVASKLAVPDVKIFAAFKPISDGVGDVLRQGTFYIDTWQFDSSSMVVDISARDYSKFLQEIETDVGIILADSEAGEGIEALAKFGGVPARKIRADKSYRRTIRYQLPQHYWPMDNVVTNLTSGTANMEDLMAGRNATQVGGLPILNFRPSLVHSERSEFFSPIWSGTNGRRLQVSNSASLNSASEWTVSFLCNVSELPTGNDRYQAVSKWDGSGGAAINYSVGISNLGSISADFTYASQSTRTTFTTPTGVVKPNTTHYVSARFDGPSRAFYIDVDDQRFEFPLSEGSTKTNSAALGIGAYNFTNTSSLDEFRGALAHVSFFSRALDHREIEAQMMASKKDISYFFPHLYSIDETVWSAMTTWAMADIGTFYFDRDDDFHYNFRNSLYEKVNKSFKEVQQTISDDTFVISGSYNAEVQANRIVVMINPMTSINSGFQSIWTPNGEQSLAVTRLGASIGASATSASVSGDLVEQAWPAKGYFKLGNEIIKYGSRNVNTFSDLERGVFGTTPAPHASSKILREARYYDVKYSNAPAIGVQRPFISAEFYYELVDIDLFKATPFAAKVVVSAKEKVIERERPFVWLQGTDLEGESNYFSIAGIPLIEEAGTEEVVEEERFINRQRRGSKKELVIDNKFIQNEKIAATIADYLFSHFKDPVPVVTVETMGLPHLELGDRVKIANLDQLGIVDEEYWIISINTDYDGGLRDSLVLRKVDGF